MSISISYHLNKRRRDTGAKELSIIGRVSYSFKDANGEQRRKFKFSTGYSCPVKKFHNSKVDSLVADASHINSKLAEFTKKAKKLYEQFEDKKNFPTESAFKEKLFVKVVEVEEDRDFVKDFEQFIEYHENKGSALTTVRNLKQTLSRIKDASEKKKYPLDYSSMNLNFYSKFIKFCREVKVSDEVTGLKDNTIGSHIKLLKTFLNYASSLGWNKYNYYKHRDFKILFEKIKVVSLTEEEVSKVAELKLSHRPRLELTRDFFLLGCETGLRFSDYSNINKKSIKEVKNGYNLEVRTTKTKTDVVIPLSQLALDILKKYNYELPEPPTNQKLNENLKTVIGLAKIDKSISSHDARRTFATIQYNLDTPVQWIMLITGHSTEREFYKYVGKKQEKNADKVRDMHSKYQIEKKGLIDSKLKIA